MVVGDTDPSVHFLQSDITLYEDSSLLDTGTVKISEACLSWEGASLQFSIPYSQITLHAIANNTAAQIGNNMFPHSHLLVMIDGDRVWDPNGADKSKSLANEDGMAVDETGSGDESGGHEVDRDVDCPGTTSVLRFVPPSQAHLEVMYTALAVCQSLNPDPKDDNSDLDDLAEDDECEENDGDTEVENHAYNRAQPDPDQFADA